MNAATKSHRPNDPVWQAFQEESKGTPFTAEEERRHLRGIREMNQGLFFNIEDRIKLA